jgi:quinol---cytochrome c reductase cytochrome c subunit, bacillus type
VSSLDERRRYFQQYKEDVKERGKPFYPWAMFHDTVMSFVVVSVIVGLAAVWKYTAGEVPDNPNEFPEPGWLGKIYDEPADPGTINFVPRPDWYFYFLFYLLRIFKWPESVILGTIGIPTIALMLLIVLPFVDTRLERRILRRPVAVVGAILTVISMGVLTYKGAVAKESLASENRALVPSWVQKQNFEESAPKVKGAGSNAVEQAKQGAEIFAQLTCLTCHTYLGAGSSNLGAPDLSAEGAKNKGLEFQIKHLRDPRSTTPGSPMPAFADLGEDNLKKLAVFLEASRGGK